MKQTKEGKSFITKFLGLIKKYLKNILICVNLFFALLLLLAYFSVYVNPSVFPLLAFLGLGFSVLLFLNFVFLVFWSFTKSKFFLISAISIISGFNLLTDFIQFNFIKRTKAKTENEIKVLTYNVRVFDLWNWSSDKDRASQIYKFLRESKADIVCLQEFYSSKIKGKNSKDSLLKDSVLKFAHISYTKKNGKTYNHGIATFSTFNIVNKGNLKLSETDNFCIFTDLLVNNDTIRVYNIHLESVHLGYDDYELIENIKANEKPNMGRIKRIVYKLKKGFEIRAKQADLISENISACKYPVVVCGDFNDTPISYAYQKLAENLFDSFCEYGNGISSTYINRISTFRIDCILHSKYFNTVNYKTMRIKLSDHYPVEAVLTKSAD
ncbi:MAG: endonuclease/exonuclease/phosphatase family protein [Bacteroidales bacterium]